MLICWCFAASKLVFFFTGIYGETETMMDEVFQLNPVKGISYKNSQDGQVGVGVHDRSISWWKRNDQKLNIWTGYVDNHRYMERPGSWIVQTCLGDLCHQIIWSSPFIRPEIKNWCMMTWKSIFWRRSFPFPSSAGSSTASGAMRRAVAIDFGGTAEISGPRWRKNFDVRWRCGGGGKKWWNCESHCDVPLKKWYICLLSVFDVARSTSANFLSCVCSNSYVCRPCSFILFFLCFLLCLVIVFLMFLLLAVAFTVVPIVAAPNGSLSFGSSGHCLDSGTIQTPICFDVLNK